MIIIATGVTIGHHCRSFQSTQKSQSPANNSRVMSAAAPTTNAAVSQKTMSHFRSRKTYLRLSRLRSSSWRARAAVSASLGIIVSLPPAVGDLVLDAQQSDERLDPDREDTHGEPGIGHEGP